MRTLQEVLDALAVPGSDHEGVVEYLSGSMRLRRRHRSLLGLGAVAALVVVGVAFAATGTPPDDEVVADRRASEPRRSTTTTLPESVEVIETTTAPATTTTQPPVASTTTTIARRSTSTSPPFVVAMPATTTTTVPDRPLTASLEAISASPTVGEVATFRVAWSDPDMPADVQPSVSLQPGDPAVVSAEVAVDATACAAGGQPRTGTADAATRYTRAGTYTVAAVVSACGRSFLATTTITVRAPSSGRAVVVTTADPSLHPESANVTFSTDPGDPDAWLPFPPRSPSLQLFHDGAPATVVLLDPAAVGTMRLQFGSSSLCAPVDLTQVPAEVTARVSVTSAC